MNNKEFKTTLNKINSAYYFARQIVLLFLIFAIIFFSVFHISEYISTKCTIIGYPYLSALISAIIFMWITSILYKTKYFKHTSSIGFMTIGVDNISIQINLHEFIYKINEVTDLNIYYNGYYGLSHFGRLNMGESNYITFVQNGCLCTYRFDLESIDAKNDLKVCLEEWYKRRNKFKEYTFGNRSLLLMPEKEISNIGELKSKYDIQW